MLHCTKCGKGPLLFLIHGAGSDSSYFAMAVEHLQKDHRVVTYDRCGCSKSIWIDGCDPKKRPERFSIEQQVQDAKAVLDALPAEKAVVAGVSAGGIIALQFAWQYPQYVSGLILYEPPFAMEEPQKEKFRQWLTELQRESEKKHIASALLKFHTALGGTDPDAPGISLQKQGQNMENLKVFLYYEMQEFLTYGERQENRIPLTVPCILGAGTKDAAGICSQAAFSNAKALGCCLSRVDGYHNFAQERPQQFAAWIRNNSRQLEIQASDASGRF